MHHRRARPTLRLLAEDLHADWESPYALRLLADENYDALHPLSELRHPLILKATEAFGTKLEDDNHAGFIRCTGELRFMEIKSGQWRGGVWVDPATGVHWLCVGGLAKGDHKDNDDFYEALQRSFEGVGGSQFLPTDADQKLLKIETLSRRITQWELEIQRLASMALSCAQSGKGARFDIKHPLRSERMASIDLQVTSVVEPDYEADECTLDVCLESAWRGSDLGWQLTTRLLIALCPPEQGWDRHGDAYSNILDPGGWIARASELAVAVERNELIPSLPGQVSHYCHRDHLAGSTISGTGVRGLCGAFFVPTQDHEALPPCPECEQRLSRLAG